MVSMEKQEKTPDFYQQLNASDAHHFHWYQCQWKTDMRNRTLRCSKNEIKLFEMGLPINETQFSKNNNNKKWHFLLHKLMLILVNINGNQQSQDRYVL